MSRSSVSHNDQKMFYGLKGIMIGARGVGKKNLLKSLSNDQLNYSRVVLNDKASNVDFIVDFSINPKQLLSSNEYICYIFAYDISQRDSFDIVCDLFESQYAPSINKAIQFTLLLGNKCDKEAQREVQSLEAENFASQNSMIFIEASSSAGKNIEYLQKLIRVRSSQMLNKLKIKPTQEMIPENPKEDNNSLECDSLEQSEKKSQTPPSLPPRAQQSSGYDESPPPQVPNRSSNQEQFTPVQQTQGVQNETSSEAVYRLRNQGSLEGRPLPNDPSDTSEGQTIDKKKLTNSKTREQSLFSELVEKPIIKKSQSAQNHTVTKNLGAKFKAVQKESQDSDQKQQNIKHNRQKQQNSIGSPPKIIHYQNSDDEDIEKEMFQLEDSIYQLDHQLEQKQKSIRERDRDREIDGSTFNDRRNSDDQFIEGVSRHFIQQEDSFVPVVDTYLYEQKVSEKPLSLSSRSRSLSPMITSSYSLLGLTNSSGLNTTDPRLYSPIEIEQDNYIVEVFKDDTLSLLTERAMHQIKSTRSCHTFKQMSIILELEISKFNKELQIQLQIIEKKKLNQKEALGTYFNQKLDLIKQQIGKDKIQNNWQNPKMAIGKVLFQTPQGQAQTLHIHENDDPYDLAFSFILDNDIKKSKIMLITSEIAQVMKNYKPQIMSKNSDSQSSMSMKNSKQQIMPQNSEGQISLYNLNTDQSVEEERCLFKSNFDCGRGKILKVVIKEGDDVGKYVHKLVLENQIKYETHMKMLKIINDSIFLYQQKN